MRVPTVDTYYAHTLYECAQDIIISVVLVVVFVVAGLVQTVFAARWQAAPDSCSLSGTLCRDKNWWKVTTCAAVSNGDLTQSYYW